MEKIRKSFLRSSVMVLAVMALSSSVAQAQNCIARAKDVANGSRRGDDGIGWWHRNAMPGARGRGGTHLRVVTQ